MGVATNKGSQITDHRPAVKRCRLQICTSSFEQYCTYPEEQVSWQNDPNLRGERLNDALMAVSSVDSKFSTITATALNRASLGGSFELPAKPVAATHIYLFFASSDGMDYSDSSCFVTGTGGFQPLLKTQ